MDAGDIDAGFGDQVLILVGSQRSGASALSDHLMNGLDNDHVTVLDIDGFMADDLHGALAEAYAISKGTQCTQFMFSLSLNPPEGFDGTEQDFLDAADRAGDKLGLSDQPRTIIMHEKEGRRHAHVVWSRIDADTMTAINLPHFKTKLRDLSRDLFLDHGWELPNGLQSYGGKNPLNFTLAEWQQAKRTGVDPREIKQIFRDAWERSDSLKGLSNALEERGYFLAKGDRRGFVVLDHNRNVYSLPKWLGERTKTVAQKLGSPDQLDSVTDVSAAIKSRVSQQLLTYIDQTKAKHRDDAQPLMDAKSEMVQDHRKERKALKDGQQERWKQETKDRQAKLNGGLRGLFDRLTGKHGKMQRQLEREAYDAAKRDQNQRNTLVIAQMKDRRVLQRQISALRDKQQEDRKLLARAIGGALERAKQPKDHSRSPARHRDRGFDLTR